MSEWSTAVGHGWPQGQQRTRWRAVTGCQCARATPVVSPLSRAPAFASTAGFLQLKTAWSLTTSAPAVPQQVERQGGGPQRGGAAQARQPHQEGEGQGLRRRRPVHQPPVILWSCAVACWWGAECGVTSFCDWSAGRGRVCVYVCVVGERRGVCFRVRARMGGRCCWARGRLAACLDGRACNYESCGLRMIYGACRPRFCDMEWRWRRSGGEGR